MFSTITFFTVPSAPTTTGITTVFICHILCISSSRSLYLLLLLLLLVIIIIIIIIIIVIIIIILQCCSISFFYAKEFWCIPFFAILKINFLTIPSATLSKIFIFNAFQFICLSNGLIEFFKISKLSFHDACNVVMCQTFINIGSLQQPQFQAEPNLRKQAKKTCFAISTVLTLCYFFSN